MFIWNFGSLNSVVPLYAIWLPSQPEQENLEEKRDLASLHSTVQTS